MFQFGVQDLRPLTEQWTTVPRVVEELIEVQSTESSSSISKDDLYRQVLACKKIYEGELMKMMSNGSKGNDTSPMSKSRNTRKGKHGLTDDLAGNLMDYDSEETIEMTEDEVNDAYNSIASKIPTS